MKINVHSSTKGNRVKKLGVASLLALSALVVNSPVTVAAEEAKAATSVQSTFAADAVVPDAKVTLEARRLPLSQVLAAVTKQTKITLTIAPDVFAKEPRTTMAVSQMPLRAWMESLATLYDARWEATGAGAFRLQSLGLSENEQGVRHLGDQYNYWGESVRQARRPNYLPPPAVSNWKNLVDNNLDPDVLSTTGVPFAEAPPEVQRAARAAVESQVAMQLLWDAVLLQRVHGPLTISITRPEGGGGYTFTPTGGGKRRAKTVFVPFSLWADVSAREDATIGRFFFDASTRGRELLDDPSVFERIDPNQPNLAQLQPPVQGEE